jgi:hypothetical protein
MNRIIKYSEPVPFHKAMPGARKLVIMKRIDDDDDGFTPAVSNTAKPKNIPNAAKTETTMTDYGNDISRGPYHAMIDRQALARQAQAGESYAKAFTNVTLILRTPRFAIWRNWTILRRDMTRFTELGFP